jgi:flavin-dependent dehydrogenase
LTHESDFLFNPYGNGWHLERVQFDRFLAASAEAEGAEVYCGGRPVGVARTASGWRVEVRFADHLITFRCKFLVDATGRSCWLAHRLGARRQKMDCLVGIVAQIRTDSSREYDRRLLLEAVEGGWWYSGYLPNDTLIATFMTDMATAPQQIDDPFTFWRRSVEQTDYTLKRLAKERPPSSVKVVSANSYLMSSVAGDSWLAIGDAAMAWDPLSSQGIFRAIQDGTRAAKCIGAALLGDDMALREYSNHTNVTYDRYRESRDYYYGLVRRWPKSEFWLQRQPSQTP